MSLIESISVSFSKAAGDQPSVTVPEYHSGNNDINAGFGGDFVWLVPHRTDDHNKAASFFKITIGDEAAEHNTDLARGTGGKYRYLVREQDPQGHTKISDVRLWRGSAKLDHPPEGYHGMTGDINAGRKGDYLYLIWKAKTV